MTKIIKIKMVIHIIFNFSGDWPPVNTDTKNTWFNCGASGQWSII